jgi:hypothetical protein
VVDTRLSEANGFAEREAALPMLGSLPGAERMESLTGPPIAPTRAFGIGKLMKDIRNSTNC